MHDTATCKREGSWRACLILGTIAASKLPPESHGSTLTNILVALCNVSSVVLWRLFKRGIKTFVGQSMAAQVFSARTPSTNFCKSRPSSICSQNTRPLDPFGDSQLQNMPDDSHAPHVTYWRQAGVKYYFIPWQIEIPIGQSAKPTGLRGHLTAYPQWNVGPTQSQNHKLSQISKFHPTLPSFHTIVPQGISLYSWQGFSCQCCQCQKKDHRRLTALLPTSSHHGEFLGRKTRYFWVFIDDK